MISSFTVGMELCRGNFTGLSIKCDIANPFKRPFGFFFWFFLQVNYFLQSERSHAYQKPMVMFLSLQWQWQCTECRRKTTLEFIHLLCNWRIWPKSTFLLYSSNSTVIDCFFFCNIETQFWFRLFIERKVRRILDFSLLQPIRLSTFQIGTL